MINEITYRNLPIPNRFEQFNLPLLNKIEVILDKIQKALGQNEIRILGGSACAILDHFYQDKPFKFRDLDVGIVLNRCVTLEETQQFAYKIKSVIPEILSIENVEVRERTPENFPLKEDSCFTSGCGFFLVLDDSDLPLLDITFFDHDEDLKELNGLLFQDSIFIVLNPERTFSRFIESCQTQSFYTLVRDGFVEEPEGAYENWTGGKLYIRNWAEINRRTHLSILRIVRTYGKNRQFLENILSSSPQRSDFQKQWKDLHQLTTSNQFHHYGMQQRLFERCLKDLNASLELKALCQLGVFDHWLPYLKEAIDWLSMESLEQKIQSVQNHSLDRLVALLKEFSEDKILHTLFFAFGGMEKIEYAMQQIWTWISQAQIFSHLGSINLSYCFKLISKNCASAKFLQSNKRIIESRSLQESERFNLLLKNLVLTEEELSQLFPPSSQLKAWWNSQSVPRKGFFTGVFDPFTNAHLEIVTYAIDQLVLEHLFVAPVHLSRKINRPCLSWDNRHLMVEKGLEGIHEAKVVEVASHSFLTQSIGKCFDELRKVEPANWFHVSGGDAFERFRFLNLLETYQEKKIRLFVVERLGIKLSPIPPFYQSTICIFSPPIPVGIQGNLSARMVRQIIEQGGDVNHLVPLKVHQLILAKGFYLPPLCQQMPWKIYAPESFHSTIKEQLPFAQLMNVDLPYEIKKSQFTTLLFEESSPSNNFTLRLFYTQAFSTELKLFKAVLSDMGNKLEVTQLIKEFVHSILKHH